MGRHEQLGAIESSPKGPALQKDRTVKEASYSPEQRAALQRIKDEYGDAVDINKLTPLPDKCKYDERGKETELVATMFFEPAIQGKAGAPSWPAYIYRVPVGEGKPEKMEAVPNFETQSSKPLVERFRPTPPRRQGPG